MRKIKTTNRFLLDFPAGIELLNVTSCRYYYFDKTKGGKIAQGIFWESLTEKDFPSDCYDFVYDRLTKQTYKLNNRQRGVKCK